MTMLVTAIRGVFIGAALTVVYVVVYYLYLALAHWAQRHADIRRRHQVDRICAQIDADEARERTRLRLAVRNGGRQ
jgi:hypothetical protein